MLLVPYYCYEFDTQLPPEEIKKKLEEITMIEVSSSFFIPLTYYTGYTGALFTGEIEQNGFSLKKLKPIPFSRRMLSPVLVLGKISQNRNGSTIKVKFRLFYSILIFGVIWMGILLYFIFSQIESITRDKEQLFLFIMFFVFSYGFFIRPLNVEVKRTKKIFKEMFVDSSTSSK